METRVSNILSLRVVSIGSTKAWFPSLRSTLHQVGGFVIALLGQVLLFKETDSDGLYFVCLSLTFIA